MCPTSLNYSDFIGHLTINSFFEIVHNGIYDVFVYIVFSPLLNDHLNHKFPGVELLHERT